MSNVCERCGNDTDNGELLIELHGDFYCVECFLDEFAFLLRCNPVGFCKMYDFETRRAKKAKSEDDYPLYAAIAARVEEMRDCGVNVA